MSEQIQLRFLVKIFFVSTSFLDVNEEMLDSFRSEFSMIKSDEDQNCLTKSDEDQKMLTKI